MSGWGTPSGSIEYQWWTGKTPRIVEKRAKSLLHGFIVGRHGADGGLTVNPYAGCAHRCVYCYATYDWTPDFYDVVQAKVNAPAVLENELRKWRQRFIEPVFIASATDCYQPAEGRLQLTRKCVEVLQKFGVPYYIFTKSATIVRDLELHARYKEKCLIVWSITTIDDDLKRIIEPNASPARAMLTAVKMFHQRGVKTGVNVDPIIPGLTDGPEELKLLVEACASHGADYIDGAILRLREDIWTRLKQLLESIGKLEAIAKMERLYFHRPTISQAYHVAPASYRDQVVSYLRRCAEAAGINFGIPVESYPDLDISQCEGFMLRPRERWAQASLPEYSQK